MIAVDIRYAISIRVCEKISVFEVFIAILNVWIMIKISKNLSVLLNKNKIRKNK